MLVGGADGDEEGGVQGPFVDVGCSWRLYSASWRQVAMSSASPLRTSRRWVNWSSMLPLARSLRTNSISRLNGYEVDGEVEGGAGVKVVEGCRNSEPGNTMPALGISTTGRMAW